MEWLVKIFEAAMDKAFANWCRKMSARVAAVEAEEPVLTLEAPPALSKPDPEPEGVVSPEEVVSNGRSRKRVNT